MPFLHPPYDTTTGTIHLSERFGIAVSRTPSPQGHAHIVRSVPFFAPQFLTARDDSITGAAGKAASARQDVDSVEHVPFIQPACVPETKLHSSIGRRKRKVLVRSNIMCRTSKYLAEKNPNYGIDGLRPSRQIVSHV